MHHLRTGRARAFLLAGLMALAAPWAGAALPIQHWVQDSGARIYLIETPALPMVDVQVDFDAGSRRDPPNQVGLAGATAGMTDKGLLPPQPGRGDPGARAVPSLDENELAEAWADLGAGFGGSAGSDRMSFTLRTLSDPDLLSRAVSLASRQLGEPAFPEAVWARERERAIAAIREADTRPGTVASKAYNKAVYSGHPYGWDVTEASLRNISVDDMRAFHAKHAQACRARVSIVGAIDRPRADQVARELLSRLPQSPATCEPLPPVAEVPPLAQPVRVDIPFESAQAHVLMGQPGYKRDDPDYFAMVVGNYILGGGGFVSRLSNQVREQRGLSYSVYSYFAPGRHAGAFTVGLQTRPDQATQALEVAQSVVRRFVEEGPTAAELKAAKDNLVGGFALRLDSNRKLLGNLAAIAWHDLPLDYLDTWTRHIRDVSAQDIRAAFQRKLQPGRMAVVTVGAKPAQQAAR